MLPGPPLLWRLLTAGLYLLLSLGVHLGAAGLYSALDFLEYEDDVGEDGPEDAAMGEAVSAAPEGSDEPAMTAPLVPVQVSLYSDRAKAPAPPPEAEASPDPTPPTTTPTKTTRPAAPRSTSPNTAEEVREGRHEEAVAGRPAPGRSNNCDPSPDITKNSSRSWTVKRSLVDYYATHLRELDRQAATSTHKDARGKKDGVLIYLPRCSVLRQVGLRNGDVVHSVNDRKISTVAQAITAYLALRRESNYTVKITRKNGKKVTMTYRLN